MLQVTVGCGKVCLFYVGGCAEFTTQDGGVPRWEFFIGDRPHHPGPDKHGRRPPIAQVQPPCICLQQSSALCLMVATPSLICDLMIGLLSNRPDLLCRLTTRAYPLCWLVLHVLASLNCIAPCLWLPVCTVETAL